MSEGRRQRRAYLKSMKKSMSKEEYAEIKKSVVALGKTTKDESLMHIEMNTDKQIEDELR